jgi:DNA-3-methyladenine glycosylase
VASAGATAASAPPALGERLGEEWFAREPNLIARELLGCTLLRNGVGGTIVETEAYAADDPACHAYIGPTRRNRPIFGPPGHAYVYLSYGIHSLFNVVTEPDGVAAAVLIRALVPEHGVAVMSERRLGLGERHLCSGPGKLTVALGIGLGDDGRTLERGPIAIHARPEGAAVPEIVAGPRIGITKAVDLPWRYCTGPSRWLSRPAG